MQLIVINLLLDDYDKINDLSEEINSAKMKKNLFDATIDVSIVNPLSSMLEQIIR